VRRRVTSSSAADFTPFNDDDAPPILLQVASGGESGYAASNNGDIRLDVASQGRVALGDVICGLLPERRVGGRLHN
jgi:hypothetical protein